MIFVEVLDRSGAVKERVRVASLPATIGRGYDNDVILDDRYVSPLHGRIVAGGNEGIVVEDAGSANGLYAAAGCERVDRLVCGPETTFRIGHTMLRVRRPQDPVAPAVVEQARVLRADSWTVSIAAFVAGCGLLILFHVLNSFERIEVTQIAFGLCIAGLLVFAWAAGWALASRVVVHQARLREHMTVATLSTIALMLSNRFLETASFALGMDDWAGHATYVVTALILAVNLYGHLGLCTLSAPRHQARTAALASLVIVGFMVFAGEIADDDFSPLPTPNAALKPPFFRLARAISAEEFALEARSLKEEVDAWAKEEP